MITPSDSPSNPEGFASVTPHDRGPAPYDIQAPQADVSGAFNAANAVAGAGVLYPQGPRQAATEALLYSPQGAGEFDITAGYHTGPGQDGWPSNVEP